MARFLHGVEAIIKRLSGVFGHPFGENFEATFPRLLPLSDNVMTFEHGQIRCRPSCGIEI
jgi:hypothetical protein